MKDTVMKIAKVALPIVGIAVTVATNYFADRDLDDKVANKVSEALAKSADKES